MAGIVWWTASRVAVLADLLAAGASFRQAAAALSRRFRRRVTARAVSRAAGRFGLHGKVRGGRRNANGTKIGTSVSRAGAGG